MADAILARHEDHGGGRDAGHIDGIVAGTADDVHFRKAERAGAGAHGLDQGRGKRLRREVHDLLDADLDAIFCTNAGGGGAQFGIHCR